jgi:uncharacterized membrane protein YqjE
MIFGAARPRRPRPPPRTSRRDFAGPAVEGPLPPRLIPSIRQLVSTTIALAHTRIALAGIELEEEMQRLIKVAALGFSALILAFLGLIVGTFTIVLAVPPEQRVLTMMLITAVYLGGAAIAFLSVKAIFANRPPIFGATLAELEKDKETLSQMARAQEVAEEARDRERERQEAARSAQRRGN